mmetsp:Transcript_16399/g.32067  ORF Transcript_16399/g.32067 Transcript_16399/m.32067 type:complete len:90 (-) Transcript_16399:749-1018(-)
MKDHQPMFKSCEHLKKLINVVVNLQFLSKAMLHPFLSEQTDMKPHLRFTQHIFTLSKLKYHNNMTSYNLEVILRMLLARCQKLPAGQMM